MLKKITTQILMATTVLLFSGASLLAQDIEIRFPRGKKSTTVSGTLTDAARTYIFTGVKRGQKATATVSSPDKNVIFCRSEIDHRERTIDRTTAPEGKLYFCIEIRNWRIRKANNFKLTVTLQ
jgi:hypothetical protein